MRKLWIILGAVAVVVLLVSFALVAEFSAPESVRERVRVAAAEAGTTLEVESFRISATRGIRVLGVVATTEIPGGTVITTVDTVVLNHRLWPLLARGEVVVDLLLIDRPTIELLTDAPDVAPAGGPSGERPRLRLEPAWGTARVVPAASGQGTAARTLNTAVTVRTASINEGRLLVRTVGLEQPTTSITGLGAAIDEIHIDPAVRSVALGLTASGTLGIGEVVFDQHRLSGGTARLTAADGIFSVADLTLRGDEGTFSLDEFVVDLNEDPYRYRGAFHGSDVDLNALADIEGDRSLGTARLEFSGGGTGGRGADFVGRGRVDLDAGRIPALPELEQIDGYLATPLAGLPYEATRIDFEVVDDELRIAPFGILSEVMTIHAEGTVHRDGTIAMTGLLAMPPENAPSLLSNPIFQQFATAVANDDGWMSIPLLIGGTVEEPEIGADYDTLLDTVSGNAGVGLSSLLRSLLRNSTRRENER